MDALSAYMRDRHGFMAGKLKEGKAPDPAQLMAFLRSVCAGCGPLVQADGVADEVAVDLRSGFASVGWDVKTNAPIPGVKKPPTPDKVLGFLDKAAVKFARPKPAAATPQPDTAAGEKTDAPKKLKLEVTVTDETAAAEANDDDSGLQFGAPDPVAAPAAQAARQAQDERAARLVPTGGMLARVVHLDVYSHYPPSNRTLTSAG